jgi:hypothetical protein
MMTFSAIRSWAKSKGYSAVKVGDGDYKWAKSGETQDSTNSGSVTSVRKLATAIYNHITNNQWVEYQEEYRKKKELEEVDNKDELY